MRILLVGDRYPPAPGGIAGHVERLAFSLRNRSHQVAVVAGAQSDRVIVEDGLECTLTRISLSKIPGVFAKGSEPVVPPWPDPALVRSIERAARRIDAEIIHAHGWCEASAEVVAGRLRLPLVVTLHDYGKVCAQMSHFSGGVECDHYAGIACIKCPGSDQSVARRIGLTSVLRSQWRGTGVSRCGKSYLAVSTAVAERVGSVFRNTEIEVIPNFVDWVETVIEPLPAKPRVVYIGPNKAYKGVEEVRRAAAYLESWGWDGVILHAGGSGRDSSGLYEDLGRCSNDEVRTLLRASSALIAPALYPFPCPTVVLEAMSQGRAVIASDTGGHRDIVTPEVGCLVPVGNASLLARSIVEITRDNSRLEKMGLAGHGRVAMFSAESVVPRIVEVYAREMFKMA